MNRQTIELRSIFELPIHPRMISKTCVQSPWLGFHFLQGHKATLKCVAVYSAHPPGFLAHSDKKYKKI